ncbi:MAG: hypothetical protein JNK89_02625, partial [Saprospiraceae bacterium]|nr:hypothetical protein [Saprospiraceae bacterium]
YGNYMELDAEEQKKLAAHFARERKSYPDFDNEYLQFLVTLYRANPQMGAEHDNRIIRLLDKKEKGKMSEYYLIAEKVHNLGYVHPDTIEAVQDFYNNHKGLSIESKCLRQLILNYFGRLIKGLGPQEYADYFELTKIFGVYMNIFGNQQFNQSIKKMSMNYVAKLLRVFTDKRAKDYQDVKKFVSTQFVDMDFLKEKEVVEMFKTRRKKRKAE